MSIVLLFASCGGVCYGGGVRKGEMVGLSVGSEFNKPESREYRLLKLKVEYLRRYKQWPTNEEMRVFIGEIKEKQKATLKG